MSVKGLHVAILCVFGIICGKCYDTPSCNEIESKSAIMRLRRYLFCDYDQMLRPTANYKNATTIRFGVIPQSIHVDDATNVITVHSWTSQVWKDAHLTWDPSSYEDVKWLHVKSYEIWVPDIAVHTAGNSGVSEDMPYTSCWLYHKGDVYCVPTNVYVVQCTADHTWWPYDALNCTLQFGSWSYSTEEIEFRFIHYELTMEKYEKNLEWDILRIYTVERIQTSKHDQNFDTKLISYHMILRRYANEFSSTYVMRAVVLMIMTLLTLWLEPKSVERMTIANLNFICHLLCIQDLRSKIPYNGSYPPKLLLFYETSLMLASVSLIFTSILRHMQELNVEAPVWISSSTASVLRSKVGQILLVSILDPKVSARIEADADDNTDLVSSNKKEATWGYAAILAGWIAFLTVLLIYVVMLFVYLPTSSSGSSFTPNS